MAVSDNEHRHLALLICILLLFIFTPFLVSAPHGTLILNLLAVSVLLTASYALSRRGHLFKIAIGLSLLSVVLTWSISLAPSQSLRIAAHGSIVVLVAFFAVTMLKYALRAGRVNADRIYAAVCVYMLMGYAWAFGYSLLVQLQPDAFALSSPIVAGDGAGLVMQMRYFSFVTLTTMGYGDIVPRSDMARTMAVLEAVTGQLYLVALVGRLISLHIMQPQDESAP